MSSNYCIECGVDMGPSNPRQLCCKSYCDKSYCVQSYYNDDKSFCNDDKSFYEPDAVAQDEPSSPFTLPHTEPEIEDGEPEIEVIQKYKKYRNEHIHALSTLEAKVAHLEKQVNWLIQREQNTGK